MAATRHLVCEGDEPIGRLEIRSQIGAETVVVGAAAADRGVLLGRYERCDVDGLRSLAHARISRVQCLLLRVDGTMYAIDTASTNGMSPPATETLAEAMHPGRLRLLALCAQERLDLGGGAAQIHWQPMQ
jgi:hypothetical protein